MPLMETTIGRLYSDDVGRRVVITRDGVAFDGTLAELDVTRSDYEMKGRPKVTARLIVKVIEPPKKLSFSSSDTVLAELKLTALPLDYKIQVEQDWVPLGAEPALPGTDKENPE